MELALIVDSAERIEGILPRVEVIAYRGRAKS
jgi:hypothetical protein